jgi:hypothetical protein
VLPAYAAIAVIFAMAVHDGARWAAARGRRWLPVAIYALALLQVVRLAYVPTRLLPTAEDVATGGSVVAQLAAMPGDVFAPDHGYLSELAGKKSYAHSAAIWDVLRSGSVEGQSLAGELNEAFRGRRFDSIVSIVPSPHARTWFSIDQDYAPAEDLIQHRSRFWLPARRYQPKMKAGGQESMRARSQ